MPTHWLEEIQGLSAAELTVLAQAMSVEDMDNILYPAFYGNLDVPSIELNTITEVDNRYAASFREWNARGRYIPQPTPRMDRLEMIPIESYDKIGEKEMQKIQDQTAGNEAVYKQIIGASVPARVQKLVQANFRRLEAAAMEAWAKGSITYENPQTGASTTFDFGIDNDRQTTASTAWNDGGTNAYDDLVAWLIDAQDAIGSVEGVVLRRATYNAIRADAPNILDYGANGIQASRSQIESRISDDIGDPFRFVIMEHTYDAFTDGGTATSATKFWPAQFVAAIPSGRLIGNIARAPVVRAREIANQVPQAGVDVRGMTVYYDYENGGRTAVLECQANQMPAPIEQKVFTIDAGV